MQLSRSMAGMPVRRENASEDGPLLLLMCFVSSRRRWREECRAGWGMTAMFNSTNTTFYNHMYEISLGELQESSSAGWFSLCPVSPLL